MQSIIDTLSEIGDATGAWSSKYDCRRTGASLHVKFEKSVDPLVTMQFVQRLQDCPALLVNACERLLASDAALQETRNA